MSLLLAITFYIFNFFQLKRINEYTVQEKEEDRLYLETTYTWYNFSDLFTNNIVVLFLILSFCTWQINTNN